MSKICTTIKLQIYPTTEQKQLLSEMMNEYCKVSNYISEYIFNNNFCLNSKEIQKQIYNDLRTQFNLKSQQTISAIRGTVARYKTLKTVLAKEPHTFKDKYTNNYHSVYRNLSWLMKPINFKRPQVDLQHNRDYWFSDKNIITMSTLNKPVKIRYNDKLCKDLLSDKYKLGVIKIVTVNKNWYIHVSATQDIEEFNIDNVSHVVGIDRGLRFLATTYDEKGKTSFISGKKVQKKRNKFAEVRKQLQAKGTKSAKRVLKRLSGRENRYMSDINHCISKALVNTYGENTLFVLEDLTGVSFEETHLNKSKKQNNDLRSWSFYQLGQFLQYKAEMNKSKVIEVDAYCTSQRCPKCGTIHKENRDHKYHRYICCNCGYSSNDDRIGAMNIQQLGTLYVSGIEEPTYNINK